MRKEALYAILAGSVLGLVIAFGVWRANIAFSPGKESPKTVFSPSPKPEFAITLVKPQSNAVITEDSVILSGISKPNSHIVILGEKRDYYTKSDTKGEFEIEIELLPAVNQIIITAFDDQGTETSLNLLLVYSSEFKKYLGDISSSEPISDGSVRSRVEQKVKETFASPSATLGTVTDISEGTIQIKSPVGEIEQLSISEDISVIKKSGKTSKEVKLLDVAIGDFIVAMGFKNGNGVINTKRILITDPLPPVFRRSVFAKVVKNDKKEVVTQLVRSQEEQKIVPSSEISAYLLTEGKYSKIKFSEIKIDDLIIAAGEGPGGSLQTRTIFVVRRP